MSLTTEQVRVSRSRTDGYALISTDRRLVLAIAEVAHANGYPIQLRTAQPMAELYVHLSRIWNAKGGTRPFTLRGKQGVWKQVDQQYLADGLMWCVKTVSRNLLKLERAGLIRYARHGYITKKYVQLLSLEAAQSNAGVAQMYAPYADEAPADTQVSITYRTSSPLGNGHEVPCLQDMKSVPNTETDDSERIDIESKQELSAAQRATPSVLRTEKFFMVRAALALWDKRQGDLGGPCSDAQSHDVLLAAVQGMTDADAAEALGTGLARGCSYWSADKPCPYGAGQLTAAARDQWFTLGPDDQTPDAPACVMWDAERGVFDDTETAETFAHLRQQPVFAAVEAPSALDREGDCSPVSVTLSDVAVSRVEASAVVSALETSPCPVEAAPGPVQAFIPVPPPTTTPVPSETRKTSIGMSQADADAARAKQLAAFKAAGFDASPSGRYGTASPSLTTTADCGEEYFASIRRSNTAVLERDDDDYPF